MVDISQFELSKKDDPIFMSYDEWILSLIAFQQLCLLMLASCMISEMVS